MIGISRPIVKHSFMVKRTEDLPMIIKKAFHIAASGRPGPVVIDIPKDLTRPDAKFEYHYPETVKMRSYAPAQRGHTGQIKKAAKLLLAAEASCHLQRRWRDSRRRISAAADAAGAQMLNYPVTNTLMGLGGYPGTDRRSSGCSACTAFTRPIWPCTTAIAFMADRCTFR
jgi:acetolactate synthase-1/2/3 large subunit